MNKPLMDILAEGHYAANLDAVPGESYNTECESLVRKMLLHLGEDPGREGLERTPQRVAKAMNFLTSGYRMSVADVVKDSLFSEDSDEMIVVKDIEFYSLCEHHMLPFVGRAHVGYLPKGQVIGLSKIARIIDCICASPPAPGTSDQPGCHGAYGGAQGQGRGRGDGGESLLHDHAGGA